MASITREGKARRLDRIVSPTSGRSIFVPLDDTLIAGPSSGLPSRHSRMELISENPPDAIIGFVGLFRNYAESLRRIPGVLNITASTIRSHHTYKVLIGTVEQAIQLGLDAVAAHVNIGSKYEPEMLRTFGAIANECSTLGMPLLAIMYPRSEGVNGDDNFDELKRSDRRRYSEMVAHAAVVGADLGGDIVKTRYTGDPDSFRFVVDACAPVPVVAAGGPALDLGHMLQMAHEVVSAGAKGVSFGRNVSNRSDPRPYIAGLQAIVHEGVSPKVALDRITQQFGVK